MGMLVSPYSKGPVKLPDLDIPKIKPSEAYLEMKQTPKMSDDQVKALIKKYPPQENNA
jgi:hypothetical protein